MILFTFLKLFNNKYKSLGFDLGTFHDYVLICINEQIEAIYNEDELSIFWRIVEFLLATREIAHYEDILIESGKNSENFFDSRSKKDVKQQVFQQPKTLLYLRFTKVHIMYQERHQRQRNVKGLDLKALQHYLKNSEAFVGYKRGKKFRDKTYSCWVFDMHYLPLEIAPSIEQNSMNYQNVVSVSGGQSSAYIAANYPFDYAVFSLVRIEDPKCRFPDETLRKRVEDRLQMPFIGTAEDDTIIYTIFDLEQFIGRPIKWVSGITFDEVIRTKCGWLPNKKHRYCTTHLKIDPIFYWWADQISEP